ncbi:hypothetical protein HK405_003463, partial [Cladochytrium tenue]
MPVFSVAKLVRSLAGGNIDFGGAGEVFFGKAEMVAALLTVSTVAVEGEARVSACKGRGPAKPWNGGMPAVGEWSSSPPSGIMPASFEFAMSMRCASAVVAGAPCTGPVTTPCGADDVKR